MSIFKNWELKKSIVPPILVNLLTAFIIFFVAVMLKERIYKWLKPLPRVENFPLFCVAETYEDNGKVFGDFFIINLDEEETYSYTKLKNFIRQKISDQDASIEPHIKVRWKRNYGKDKIVNISVEEKDTEFNKGKGEIEVDKPENIGNCEEWIIKVSEIESKAILRLTIQMTEYEGGGSRAAKSSQPFEYSYPRDPKF